MSLSPAQARPIPTAKVLKEGSPGSERVRLNAFLEREEVQNQLEARGLDKAMTKARVDDLISLVGGIFHFIHFGGINEFCPSGLQYPADRSG